MNDVLPIGSEYLSGALMTDSESRYNCRVKYYLDADGVRHPYEMMVSDKGIFRQSGTEVSEFTESVEWRLDYNRADAELYSNRSAASSGYESVKSAPDHEESLLASRRRARRKVFDLIACNPFDCFVTLTLNGDQIDRHDYAAVIKSLSTFLDNSVRRKGLIYVGVPELHIKGGLHFHFCMNSVALKLVDSGTVSIIGQKRPIKVSTADRRGIPLDMRHPVYNVTNWKFGFSTAIMTYGDRGAIAHYMAKELNKSQQKCAEKIGGRWYLSGGKLARPVIELSHVDYSALSGETYAFACPVGHIKVFNFADDGSVICD